MYPNPSHNTNAISNHLRNRVPTAFAKITGTADFPSITGGVTFYQVNGGSLVAAEIWGLPESSNPCASNIFAFHIHEGSSCSGNAKDPLANTGGHLNPHSCPHPSHAGDMPPLFASKGYAWVSFLTGRFSPEEVIGHTVIIHDQPDDFTTQPSGNAGKKIACGVIQAI